MAESGRGSEDRFEFTQMLDRAMRELRAAEDFARLEMRDECSASRVREVYETLTEDCMNGRSTVPSRAERLGLARMWLVGEPRNVTAWGAHRRKQEQQ